ncbi:Ankyrin repeat domain-containing protein 39 [Gryllus bimaculatus]|nr:Ankyrin repeat domain-containing protein 39 [Gryllus bimaculatus]
MSFETMSHNCGHSHSVPSSVYQTLEELDFERGIWYAAQHNDITRIEKLLRQGVSPNAEDAAGYTALHYASRAGHLELCRILLSAGAEPNSLTRAGRASSLHRAASRGLVDIVKLLLKSGALPDLQDSDGKTALHRAVEGGHYLVAQALLDVSDVSKKIPDLKGQLPIDYAKGKENMELVLS